MYHTLFEKTGIKLTDIQQKILRDFFKGIMKSFVIGLFALVVDLATGAITLNCVKVIFLNILSDSYDFICINQAHVVPDWTWGILVALIVVAFVPFLTGGATYLSQLVSNRDFREKEMAESVDFVEDDEREQFMTMRATRRAYMAVNFTLLVFWLVCLVTGDFSKAATLFIVQVIGALSYRREMRK